MVHDYDRDDFVKYREQLTAQLLAGDADDMFDASIMSNMKLHESGYVADIYPLMRNDPDFNEDDYFMNVFEAISHKGKLMVFPTQFFYEFYGVNNRFSADLVARFQQSETVTNRQIVELYKEFAGESGLYAYQDLDTLIFLLRNIQEYIDYENKTCDFVNGEFIKLLHDLKEATNPQRIANGFLGTSGDHELIFTTPMLEEEALKYMFRYADSGQFYYPALFPFVEPQAFMDFKPVVTESGELQIGVLRDFAISEASTNKELAWEFLKFLTTPEANDEEYPQLFFPVHRGLFQSYMKVDLAERAEYWRERKAIDGDNEAVAARQIAIYEKHLAMPMKECYRLISGGTGSIGELMLESITAYCQDMLTAELLASELQNKVSIYLIE